MQAYSDSPRLNPIDSGINLVISSSSDNHADRTEPTHSASAYYLKTNRQMAQLAASNEHLYAQHISKGKELILEAAKGLDKNALVVGVGNGNDIPLKELAQQFEQLTLVDIDSEAMERAVNTLEPELQKKIITHSCDITGVVAPLSHIVEQLAEERDYGHFCDKFFECLETTQPTITPMIPLHQAQLVVSSLVLSQLGSELMLYICDFVKSRYHIDIMGNQTFLEKISEYANQLQKHHLEDLSNWTSESGKVYLSDTIAEIYLRHNLSGGIDQTDPYPMILKPTYDHLDALYIKNVEKDWNWIKQMPKAGAIGSLMVVSAYILTPKKESIETLFFNLSSLKV